MRTVGAETDGKSDKQPVQVIAQSRLEDIRLPPRDASQHDVKTATSIRIGSARPNLKCLFAGLPRTNPNGVGQFADEYLAVADLTRLR